MTKVPPEWESSTLGAIGEYVNGRGFKKSEWRDSGRPIIRIQNLTGSSPTFNYYEGEADERNIVRTGDLLVSWAATLGAYVWKGPEAVLNQHIFKVRSLVDQRFHYYLLLATLDALRRQTHGSGMVHITKKLFDETPVMVPPLVQQRRIVDAIEEQFSRIAAAEESLLRAKQSVERLRDASLARALQGDWPLQPLSQVIKSLRNGVFVSRPGANPPGIPILRISAVRPMKLDVNDFRYASIDESRAAGYFVDEGDLLFTRYSGNPEFVGSCARVPPLSNRRLHPDKLIRVVVDCGIVQPGFVELAVSTGNGRKQIEERLKTTAGQVGIAGGQLKTVVIPVPPLDEQRRILEHVEARLSGVDAMRRHISESLTRASAIRRAVLRDAFAGRLGTVARDQAAPSAAGGASSDVADTPIQTLKARA